LVKAWDETGTGQIMVECVEPDAVENYGIADLNGESAEPFKSQPVKGLVEKPSPKDAPSNLAVLGRYVLPSRVLELLESTTAGVGGEIQLTDALQYAAKHPEIAGGVRGVIFDGRRYDTGDKLDFIKATLKIAIDREDIGPELRLWLKQYAETI